jgi:hypothetical protein
MPRVGKSRTKVKVSQTVPHGSTAWNALMRRVIAHVEKTGDSKRLEGLKTALTRGQSEKVLRQYGIIGERDIQREFPSPTK